MQGGATSYLWHVLLALLTLLITCRCYLSHHFHRRISSLRSRRAEDISVQKIIVAFQPNNIFFRFSTTYKPGYSELVLPLKGWESLWAKILRFLGKGYFYRLKQSKKSILSFLETLSQTEKIELFLYTKLPMNVIEAILQRINILRYFPLSRRRSCGQISCEHIKHPTEVDIHTKRVLILTGQKDDHHQEDNKYFLVVNKKEINLSKTARLLQNLIQNNEQIDEFHNQLAVVKAHIESQPETPC